jgi:flagellar protein FliO/FliZ
MPSLPKAVILLASLRWQEPTPYDPTRYDAGGGASFALMLLETLLALALVCGIAYAIFRWLPRLQAARSANSMIRVVDRVGLDARKSLFVIEVGGRWLLVAASESGVQLLSELDAAELQSRVDEADAARAASRAGRAERFASLLNRRK